MCSCSKNSKISGMKKINVKSLSEKLIPAATIAVGFAAAKIVPYVVGKVYKPKDGLSNTIVGASEVVAGIVLSTMKNKHVANLGLGMAVSGLHTFLAKPVDQAFAAAGLSGVNSIGYPKYLPNYASMGCNDVNAIRSRSAVN